MGGLRKYMPITWITSLVGSLALIGTPFLSGFYSKDSIIEAVALSNIPGAGFAYFAVMAGVFVTAFYSFRMYFLVFHGEERFGKAGPDDHHDHHGDHDDEETSHDHHHGLAPGQKPHETPGGDAAAGAAGHSIRGHRLYRDRTDGFRRLFKMAIPGTDNIPVIFIDANAHPAMAQLSEHFHGAGAMGIHSTLPFLLALAGVVLRVVLLHEASRHSGGHPASFLGDP